VPFVWVFLDSCSVGRATCLTKVLCKSVSDRLAKKKRKPSTPEMARTSRQGASVYSVIIPGNMRIMLAIVPRTMAQRHFQ
jgi:hypothetical protein